MVSPASEQYSALVGRGGGHAFHPTVGRRMMRNVHNAPEKYETDATSAKRFEYLMQKLEGDLMDGHVFHNCIGREFEHRSNGAAIHIGLHYNR